LLPLFIVPLMVLPLPPTSAAMSATRLRPVSNISRAIVAEAFRRSATVRRLVTELQQLDTLVFIDLNLNPMVDRGTTSVMASAGGFRMLRVLISSALDPRRRIEVLGHELQHALEIARERSVVNDATLRDLYGRIGFAMGQTSYETAAARQIELEVRRDLSNRSK
jgi:hypothetical protein